ncbi:MAG TPA: 1-acyl-sn-glycerol-3-phosphate acyltransferase [Spirochaetota bacterium]|nr:1-acyl-sn-glycerol-3-phosphate acyltransferase [Spirochaetota bacterium]
MKGKIITSLFFIFVAITSLVFFIIAIIIRVTTYPFDKKMRLLHLLTCFWGSLYTYVMPPWKITIQGRNKIKNNKPYIIISNHQSQLDIGWNMVLNRYIKLVRGDKKSIAQMMDECEMHLKEGSSVYIFPEGSRSPDGHLKQFKSGAFLLAKKLNLPIMPIIIEGTRFALPKHSIDYHGKHPIILRVLDEIVPEIFKNMSIEELRDYTWNYMHTELKKLRMEMYGSDSI